MQLEQPKYVLIAAVLAFAACNSSERPPAYEPEEPEEREAAVTVEPPQAEPAAVDEGAEVPDRFVRILEAPKEEAPAEERTAGEAVRRRAMAKKVENEAILENLGATSGDAEMADALGSADAKGIGGPGMTGTGRAGGGGVAIGSLGSKGAVGSGPMVRPRVKGLTVSGYGGGAATAGRARVVRRPDPASNTEGYENHGVNAMTETAKDARSTFAIDVDTGAYTIARKQLEAGVLPPKDSVRVEEYVNYFRYSYRDPDSGPFGVFMEAAPSPFSADPNRKILRVGVQGKRMSRSERKPVHLTFLVDVSGSMRRPDKLPLPRSRSSC